MRHIIIALVLSLTMIGTAFAQSSPNFAGASSGHWAPLTAAALNSAFQTKADTTAGVLTNPAISGGTLTGGDVSAANATVNSIVQTVAAWLGLMQPTVATNAALKAISAGSYSSVRRLGYYAAGDGGAMVYTWSGSSSATDDGCSVVAPTGNPSTGRWLAVIDANFTPLACGAKGDGTTNDTAPVQTAISISNNSTLHLGPHDYCVDTLTVSNPTTIIGATKDNASYGLWQCTQNGENLLNITGNNVVLKNVFVYPGHPGIPASGTAITVTGQHDVISDVEIYSPCIGMDVAGNENWIDRVRIAFLPASSSCGGIRIGHTTTSGGTVGPHITNNLIEASGAGYGMRFEDCGGCYVSQNDILDAATAGTWIIPGTNQIIQWGFFDNTVLADTGSADGLVIDTAASSGEVEGLQFTGSWSSNNSSGRNVSILNSNNGSIKGIHFLGLRAYGGANSSTASVYISAGLNVTIDASHICGYGSNSTGIYVTTGVYWGAVRGSEVGGECDGLTFTNTSAAGVTFVSNNVGWVVTDNDLRYNTTPLNDAGLTGAVTVAHNLGVDDVVPTVASATTINPGPNPTVSVTGTTTITNILLPWNGRQLTIIPNAALPFATGGTAGYAMCSALTAVANVPVLATYTGSCWSLK